MTEASPFFEKVCLITGGANGMGRQFVLQLAREGARIATCDLDEAALQTLAKEPEIAKGGHVVERLDVGDATARGRFVDLVREKLGPVEFLVNNAGVCVAGQFPDIAGDDWTWMRSINLDAPVDFIRRVLPDMMAKKQGRILTISSVSGLTAQPFIFSYTATKHALVGLTKSLYQEMKPHGIKVTLACPGIINTKIIERMRFRGVGADSIRSIFGYGITPELAVRRMLRAVRRGKPFIIPNWDVRIFYQLYRVMPWAFDSLVARFANSAFLSQATAPAKAASSEL